MYYGLEIAVGTEITEEQGFVTVNTKSESLDNEDMVPVTLIVKGLPTA